ncbi:MAG TPA: YhjD/YihY/BrkB family envelope integrity protein [Dissulfurispiraceae bacterium]|nr:YhjD/YihY/BrkB family envelope integrity protein [Dissulfurispiraceae bacterium]
MNVKNILSFIETFFSRTLWEIETVGLKRTRRAGLVATRLMYKLADDFQRGEFSVRASSLVYTTLLTFVPLLAIAFSVLKAFGVHNMLAPMLLKFLEPIGDKSADITATIVGYVDKIDVKVLGTVGLALLLYTVINTVQQVENAFNHFWQISRARNFLQKVRDYLSVLFVGPILIVASLGITTTIMSHGVTQKLKEFEPFGTGIIYFGKLFPYFLTIAAFTLFYFLLPNTKVRMKSAMAGGAFAGITWQILSWAFAKFLVSTAQYSAVYSGFAIVLVFMVWLYFNWLIMLAGVKVAFYHQYPTSLGMRFDSTVFTERFKYQLALAIVYLIALNYRLDKPRWTLRKLVRHLRLPVAPVTDVLNALEAGKILLLLKDDLTYLPARDVESITVLDVIVAVRQQFPGDKLFVDDKCAMPSIRRLLERLDKSIVDAFSEETVKDLLSASETVDCETKSGSI